MILNLLFDNKRLASLAKWHLRMSTCTSLITLVIVSNLQINFFHFFLLISHAPKFLGLRLSWCCCSVMHPIFLCLTRFYKHMDCLIIKTQEMFWLYIYPCRQLAFLLFGLYPRICLEGSMEQLQKFYGWWSYGLWNGGPDSR